MKQNIKSLGLLAVAASSMMLAGCSADDLFGPRDGEGTLSLTASIGNDVKVVSRADADQLRADYGESLLLWITKPGEGPVRQYNGIDNVPTDPVTLHSGSYVAEAWAGDSVAASFDKKYFKGYTPFEITNGNSTAVEVKCNIANVVVSLSFDESVDAALKSWTVTVANGEESITYEGHDARKGYFMMPKKADNEKLTLTLEGTAPNGDAYSQTADIEAPKGGYEYKVNFSHTPGSFNDGGAFFTITVDETEIVVEDELVITLAPEIFGIDFDIAQEQAAATGEMGRKCVFISAVDRLSSLTIESANLQHYLGSSTADVFSLSESALARLAAAGINFMTYKNEAGEINRVRVNFEADFTNNLVSGLHTFKFIAGDNGDGTEKTSEATLSLRLSNAAVELQEATDVSYTTTTFVATIVKPDELTGNVGFNYREKGASDWTFVAGTNNGTTLTATVDNLKFGTTYEYCAVAGGYTSPAKELTTLTPPQLPNASFEQTSTASDKALMFSADPNDFYWDSGNHGSQKMSKNVTEVTTKYFHSGKQGLCLHSQFVGFGALGKFAAGNIFVGKYLATEGMDGVLGWGRPFNCPIRPKALKVWARYEPVNITHDDTSALPSVSKGDPDNGIVYIALVTDQTMSYNSESWPQIVKTSSSSRQLFNPSGSNVVAYGEHVFTSATTEPGLVEITIPLNDVNPSLTVSNIIIVASASRYGDYFVGGNGSLLYLDDFELVY
jgi:hypothetical protein